MAHYQSVEQKITALFEGIISFFLLAIFLITVILVILRYVFNSTIIGANELITYLFIYTSAIGAAVAIRKREHIKITFIIDKLPSHSRQVIDVIDLLLVAFINALMVYYSLPWIAMVGWDESPVIRIPLGVVKASVPIGCSLAILYCLYICFTVLISPSSKRKADTR